MTEDDLRANFSERRERYLADIAEKLERKLKDDLKGLERVDRISVRAKTIDSFLKKSKKKNNDGTVKYEDPLADIQDQIGARIVVLYTSDVEAACTRVKDYYTPIEEALKVPETPEEFSYEGYHYVAFLPDDILPETKAERRNISKFFELQIKTVFQHAWGEAGHDMVYKSPGPLSFKHKRMVAFSAAQAWGADKMFDQLFQALQNRMTEDQPLK